MIRKMVVKAAAATVAVGVALAVAGCGDGGGDGGGSSPADYRSEDCDPGDLAERDPDCGYWDASGTFVLWYWVLPGAGGTRPAGWSPHVPRGGSSVRPGNAHPNAKPRVQKAPPGAPAPRRPVPVQPPKNQPPKYQPNQPKPGSGGGYRPAPAPPRPAPPPPPRVGR